ncbi:MAG: dCTP deaminase, partial [Ignavibacteriales bacterium]|nr:dCTP deaminase [Ignavibacteriales bacterium]
MILTDRQILREMERSTIVIKPFQRKHLGSNSYDVHLGKWLAMYKDEILDSRQHNKVNYFEIPKEGLILVPSKLYLGVTEEYTETHAHVPFLEGKSSIGRLGIDIHATAGKGDIGFCNTWTLEISVRQPVRIYAGMPIGQLIYFEVS